MPDILFIFASIIIIFSFRCHIYYAYYAAYFAIFADYAIYAIILHHYIDIIFIHYIIIITLYYYHYCFHDAITPLCHTYLLDADMTITRHIIVYYDIRYYYAILTFIFHYYLFITIIIYAIFSFAAAPLLRRLR